MSYRDKTRKRITLPSGATTTIRRLSARDFIDGGNIPVVSASVSGAGDDGKGPSARQIQDGIRVAQAALLKCCGPIEMDGEKSVIVDKPFAACAAGEISMDEVTQEDATCIVNAVIDFSNIGREAAASARPFPSESPVNGANPSPGQNLRPAPDRDSQSQP